MSAVAGTAATASSATAGSATASAGSAPRIVVVGGGLAGMAAALEAADAGAGVVLVERRTRLGGLTWSFDRKGLSFDNGQHVWLRCCTAYRSFLDRIGAAGEVHVQRRLDVPVMAPGGVTAHISRTAVPLPSPLHLAPSLLAYRHLSLLDRLRLGRAVAALRRVRMDDPALDKETFASWLARHGQSASAVERLWDLVVLPTVNVTAADASLALAAKVFRTGLLDTTDGADIGWSAIPLAELHGGYGSRALAAAGVESLLGTTVDAVERTTGGAGAEASAGAPLCVVAGERRLPADAVIVALSHTDAPRVLPRGAVGDLSALGSSPIVNVHLVLDRKVMHVPFTAAVGSPVQYVFDHTDASGVRTCESLPAATRATAQCLTISLSSADAYVGLHPDQLVRTFHDALGQLFPPARDAQLLDGVVSKEHTATFRGVPGTAALRSAPETGAAGVFVAGAWCDTGWPATLEGAVRSGTAAAAAALRHTRQTSTAAGHSASSGGASAHGTPARPLLEASA